MESHGVLFWSHGVQRITLYSEGGGANLEVVEVTMESKILTLTLRIEELTFSLRGVIIISRERQRSTIASCWLTSKSKRLTMESKKLKN